MISVPRYLDYAATTPCSGEVLAAMIPFFTECYGNPNSLHIFGLKALDALESARKSVSDLISAEIEEIVFTSGATESSRMAIERTVTYLASKTGRNKFITTKSEHKSILDCADYLKSRDIEVIYLKVKSDGLIDFDHLVDILDESIGLMSICMVNNETGVLQDIGRIADLCHAKGTLLHSDATQGFGKIPINVKDLDVDFLSASGHKIYGPKGIGILFYKKSYKKFIRVPLANRDVEFGLRAGTVPVALCVGMGKASEFAKSTMATDLIRITNLRKLLLDNLFEALPEIHINGSVESNYPGIVNLSFRGCEGEALMMECKRIAVSSGSACTSNKLSISHVLEAMGTAPDIAQSSLRISIGKPTNDSDILIATEDLISATTKLRQMSPIWDMIKAGMDISSIFEGKHCAYAV
ncbi:MAG: cysteine desulfurase [Holosporales bacterium]|jgi:cysteine desulfurase|nr:cysteine desulfurase [Holosporales bacterium]